jgi:sugar diacid utilization regulator
MSIRPRAVSPEGAAPFDELGFCQLVDAADGGGEVEGVVHEWLGRLLGYDDSKNAELLMTLSDYLEFCRNHDESVAALHVHHSTLRNRLARIGELTGHDLATPAAGSTYMPRRGRRFPNPDG